MIRNVILALLLNSCLVIGQNGQDSCYPSCRDGFICYKGNCISKCNPPCPSNQKCSQDGQCIQLEENNNQRQSENNIEKTKRNIPCSQVFVVSPEITEKMLGGNFSEEEINNAANMIAGTIAVKINGTSIITNEELKDISNCNSKCIKIKLLNYHKEPARMGQFKGCILIRIEYYGTPKDSIPNKSKDYDAKGGINWGDSTPFANAVDAVCKKLKSE